MQKPEVNVLSISDYAVVIHCLAESGKGSLGESDPAAISQFERDIVSYAWRDRPPFCSASVGRPEVVEIQFPDQIRFIADNAEDVTFGPEPDRRTRTVQVLASRTDFCQSHITVLHLAIGPVRRSENSVLSEWEFIKLSKLWEDAEETSIPGSDQSWLSFRPHASTRSMNLDEYLRHLFGDGVTLLTYGSDDQGAASQGSPAVVAGTLQISQSEGQCEKLALSLEQLRQDPWKVPGSPEWKTLCAWGGIVQGLLDHTNIAPDELLDVFDVVEVSRDGMSGFNKGSLISVGAQPLGFNKEGHRVPSPMGGSPYLCVPHAVVLHNEERLRRASALRSTAQGQRIRQTTKNLVYGRATIALYLQNVFHYESEREIFKLGHEKRGLDLLHKETISSLDFAQAQLESRTKHRDVGLVFVGIALAVLAGVQSALAQANPFLPSYVVPVVGLVILASAVVWAFRQ